MTIMGTWTYSGDPAISPKDAVRFLVNDIDPAEKQISDEGIAYLLSQYGSPRLAAIAAAERLHMIYAQAASIVKEGDLMIDMKVRADAMSSLISLMKSDDTSAVPMPSAGGISIAQKQAVEQDTDRVQPLARMGQDDYPGTQYPIDPTTDADWWSRW